MDKLYKDYAWNLNQAIIWYQLIGNRKYPQASDNHKAHLSIAQAINEEFKQTYR